MFGGLRHGEGSTARCSWVMIAWLFVHGVQWQQAPCPAALKSASFAPFRLLFRSGPWCQMREVRFGFQGGLREASWSLLGGERTSSRSPFRFFVAFSSGDEWTTHSSSRGACSRGTRAPFCSAILSLRACHKQKVWAQEQHTEQARHIREAH